MRRIRSCLRSARLVAVLWATATAAMCPVSIGYGDDDAELHTVLKYQQAYFERVETMFFHAELSFALNAAMQKLHDLPAAPRVVTMRFLSSRTGYRSDVTQVDPISGETMAFTRASNGEIFQSTDAVERPVLHVTRTQTWSGGPYGSMHPLVSAFAFALPSDQDHSLAVLGEPELWSKVESTVVSFQNRQRSGHQGVQVGFDGQGAEHHDVFFAKDLDYFPVWWSATREGGGRSEMSVAVAAYCDTPQGRVIFPTRLEFADYLPSGERAQHGSLQVDDRTLTVNFTLPRSAAYVYADEDAGTQTKTAGPWRAMPQAQE